MAGSRTGRKVPEPSADKPGVDAAPAKGAGSAADASVADDLLSKIAGEEIDRLIAETGESSVGLGTVEPGVDASEVDDEVLNAVLAEAAAALPVPAVPAPVQEPAKQEAAKPAEPPAMEVAKPAAAEDVKEDKQGIDGELDALFEELTKSDNPPIKGDAEAPIEQVAKSAVEGELDDLFETLTKADKPEPVTAAPTEKPVRAAVEGELDELFEALTKADKPQPVAEAAAPAAAANSGVEGELDELFDALTKADKPEPPVEAAPPAAKPAIEGELDELFDALTKADKPAPVAEAAPEKPAQPEVEGELDALFDELTKADKPAVLSEFSTPSKAAATEAAQKEEKRAPDRAVDENLDALFEELTRADDKDVAEEKKDEFQIVRDGAWRKKDDEQSSGQRVPRSAEDQREVEKKGGTTFAADEFKSGVPAGTEGTRILAEKKDKSATAKAERPAKVTDTADGDPEETVDAAPAEGEGEEAAVPDAVAAADVPGERKPEATAVAGAAPTGAPLIFVKPDESASTGEAEDLLAALPDVERNGLRVVLAPLELVNRPFDFLSPEVRNLLGLIAITTLFNAGIVIVYVLMFKGK